MKRWFFLICLFIFACLPSRAQLTIDQSGQRLLIGHMLERYTGPEPSDFSTVSSSSAFQPLNSEVPNLGTSPDAIWLRLPVKNNTKQDLDLLLEIAYPLLDEIELYSPNENGTYQSIRLGEHQNFSIRKYKVPNYVFDIHLHCQSEKVLFLRIKSVEQIILPIYLSSERKFMAQMNNDSLLSGIYIGIVFIMAIYNLFLFFSVRDKGYLYYVLYVVCAGITQMGIKGYSFQYLWPNWPYFATKGPIIFGCLSGLSALLFAGSFLQLEKNAPRSKRIVTIFIVLFALGTILALINLTQVAFFVMQVTTGIGSLFVLYLSYRIMISGYSPAKYFVYGWTVLLLGSVVFLLKDYGILDYNNFTSNSVQIASVIEMALLSFGLAYSINILKQEKEESQQRELAISLENEQLIREQNTVLEQKVDERTHELKESNESLQTTLLHLKEAQSQLVESEKMASLGQLTAGVAHEINNPINFVTSNVAPLKRDIKMIWETLDEVERIAFNTDLSDSEKQLQIKKFKDDLDIGYLKTEVDYLLKGMDEGAHRTAEIVKSLRIFSRVDEDTLKFADINEGLTSTMIILNSLINNSIEVEKHLGNLPRIECHAGKLNQVFLNIITNAVYAIDKKFGGNSGGKLSIETGLTADQSAIYVKIADNGIGIPESIRDRIFEPFFTTKDVGEGTGLGMSIAYNTIAKHHGRIIVESEVGEGTAFTLHIPIQQTN
ncbi:7TM diverse intracellular signaling domain-containing protein [Sphingobacterium sp. BIGb0165]|uniref:sensor histidine kinase n=1 Tax=Sphingobacterium sp. BIGb0165 TaxID=2940615 RepID=UPI0021682EF1|nr:7TM diverse intracellular signaling domain-containing protein [Sphingobacterium sp. BIGb0165]MCS4227720.1 signal transduction histidine kinase [Sphingobacterium sp. BIGb0165]